MTDTEALTVTLQNVSDATLADLTRRWVEANRRYPCTAGRELTEACQAECVRRCRADIYLDAVEGS